MPDSIKRHQESVRLQAWFVARVKEPSSHAAMSCVGLGIAVLYSDPFAVNLAIFCGVIAFCIREGLE